MRERTFFAEPGLIQASDGERVWLLDPVALAGDQAFRTGLAGVLGNAESVQILHSVGEDLDVLMQLSGTLPARLFDTQIAAALLGHPLQCRYESLVETLLGVELPGGMARNNWRKRPLPARLLVYAAQDVIWLPTLHEVLAGELERAGRLAWHAEDCRRLVEQAGDNRDPVTRFKGAGRLSETELARLDRLARWREEQALRRNLPRGFIVKDPVLVQLARSAPKDAGELGRIKGLPRGLLRRHTDTLLDLIARPPDPDFRRPRELTELDTEGQARLGRMQERVRQAADRLGIDPALIASKRELTRLNQGIRPDSLDGWRGEVLGPEFLGELE